MPKGIPFESKSVYAKGPYIGDRTVREIIGVPILPCFNSRCETGTAPSGGLCTECERIVRDIVVPDRYDAHVRAWEYHHFVFMFGRPGMGVSD